MFRRKQTQTQETATVAAQPAIIAYRNPGGNVWGSAIGWLNDTHLLIAGATGCGKSTTLHAILWSALSASPAKRQFVLVDMKRGLELARYRDLPHTVGFARTAPEASAALDSTVKIMESRLESMFRRGLTMYDGANLYLVVDELAYLLTDCPGALEKLVSIARLGRAARVHLILCTQSPNRGRKGEGGVPAVLAQNMTCRIGLRCSTPIESRQIINRTGCECLPRHGVGIVYDGLDWYKTAMLMIPEEEQEKRLAWWSDPANYAVTA